MRGDLGEVFDFADVEPIGGVDIEGTDGVGFG